MIAKREILMKFALWLYKVDGKQEVPICEKIVDDYLEEAGGWAGGTVKCDLCGHEWIAVRPTNIDKLECPECNNMVNYEITDEQ